MWSLTTVSREEASMIYLDISATVHSKAGLGRYSERLAGALIARNPGRYGLFYNQGSGGRFPTSLPPDVAQRHISWGYKPWRMAVLLGHLGQMSFNHLIPEAELFHSTEHLLLPLRDVPTVLTVHDLIFKLFPEYHKKLNYWYLNKAMPIFCKRATAIIAVSEATKRDIVKYYDVDPAKVTVVYEAAANHFKPPHPARIDDVRFTYHLPEQYLIHVSTIEPRKNLMRLLDAFQILRRTSPDLHLLLAGGRGWLFDDFFARIEAEGLSQVVRPLGWIPDDDLPAIISAAALAVQPSLYEGFGLPILEHMACGQVVAASHGSSHPEVGGEAAAYFDPADTEEMAAVIARLLQDRGEYDYRRMLGLRQAAQFSWDRAAAETEAVYDHVLAG
jgi:glycosyltransferase involved in cell wall biosynthesis